MRQIDFGWQSIMLRLGLFASGMYILSSAQHGFINQTVGYSIFGMNVILLLLSFIPIKIDDVKSEVNKNDIRNVFGN